MWSFIWGLFQGWFRLVPAWFCVGSYAKACFVFMIFELFTIFFSAYLHSSMQSRTGDSISELHMGLAPLGSDFVLRGFLSKSVLFLS